jgi:hypothetical protein
MAGTAEEHSEQVGMAKPSRRARGGKPARAPALNPALERFSIAIDRGIGGKIRHTAVERRVSVSALLEVAAQQLLAQGDAAIARALRAAKAGKRRRLT